MTGSERGALSERERALVHEPLELTSAQAQRLVRAAIGVDASIWRQQMEKFHARGFRVSSPQWKKLSFEKMIPWFECKAQLALDTGMTLVEILNLRGPALQLSPCKTRLAGIGSHSFAQACSLSLEAVVGKAEQRLFPSHHDQSAVTLWFRACRNAGLLRRHPTRRLRKLQPLHTSL